MAKEHFIVIKREESQSAKGFLPRLLGAMTLAVMISACLLILAWAIHFSICEELMDLLDPPDWSTWALVSVSVFVFLQVWIPRAAVLVRAVRLEGDALEVRYGPLVRRMDLIDISRIEQVGWLIVIHSRQGAWLLRRRAVKPDFGRLREAWRQALTGSGVRPLSPPAHHLPVDSQLFSLLSTAISLAVSAVLALSMDLRGISLLTIAIGAPILLLWSLAVGRRQGLFLTPQGLDDLTPDARGSFPLVGVEWIAWAPIQGGVSVDLHAQGRTKRVASLETDAALLCNMAERASPMALQLGLEGGWLVVPSGAKPPASADRLRSMLQSYNRRKLRKMLARTLPYFAVYLLYLLARVTGWGFGYRSRGHWLDLVVTIAGVVQLTVALILLRRVMRERESHVGRALSGEVQEDQKFTKVLYALDEKDLPG